MKKDQENNGLALDSFGRLVIEDKQLLKAISGGREEKGSQAHNSSHWSVDRNLDFKCSYTNNKCKCGPDNKKCN